CETMFVLLMHGGEISWLISGSNWAMMLAWFSRIEFELSTIIRRSTSSMALFSIVTETPDWVRGKTTAIGRSMQPAARTPSAAVEISAARTPPALRETIMRALLRRDETRPLVAPEDTEPGRPGSTSSGTVTG